MMGLVFHLSIAAAESLAPVVGAGWEDRLKEITKWLATGVEACAGLIIGLAAIEATLRALRLFVGRPAEPQDVKEQIRLRLGRWLAVALEFELAADILRTAVAPTWNEIGQLAAIATLRTLLNYFLQKEIDKAAERNGTRPAGMTKTPAERVPANNGPAGSSASAHITTVPGSVGHHESCVA